MNNSKKTRKALLSSVVALMLCFSMFVGTTMAWFTDTATTSVNTIQAGTLDVMLVAEDGTTDLEGETLNFVAADDRPAEEILWEPGATYCLETVKVKNNGNLALKFKVVVNGINGDTKLMEAIDWTFKIGEEEYNANTWYPLEVGEVSDGIVLEGHMKEEAGNEYQSLSATGVSITVYATQLESEYDSYGNKYDEDAYIPFATVEVADYTDINATLGMGGADHNITLDTSFKFATTETKEQGAVSEYKDWHADFVIYADKTVPANSMAVAGYYDTWCTQYNNGKWVVLESDTDIPANTPIRLVSNMLNGGSISYDELCEYVPTFLCGATDLTGVNEGTTLTAELRMYEVTERGAKIDVETGNYITVGYYSYTF